MSSMLNCPMTRWRNSDYCELLAGDESLSRPWALTGWRNPAALPPLTVFSATRKQQTVLPSPTSNMTVTANDTRRNILVVDDESQIIVCCKDDEPQAR